MAIQAYATGNSANRESLIPLSSDIAHGRRANGNPVTTNGNRASAQVALSAEYYSSDKMVIEYQSKDGDKVTLSMEQVKYQKASIDINASNLSDEQWQRLVDKVMDEYSGLRKAVMDQFLKSQGIDTSTSTDDVEQTDQVAQVPEYWNAENTSQRIVDFALSMRDAFAGSDEEFLNAIKGAIDEGFSQALGELGKLPDSVGNLVNNTHDLVMSKLDQWLSAQQSGEELEPAMAA